MKLVCLLLLAAFVAAISAAAIIETSTVAASAAVHETSTVAAAAIKETSTPKQVDDKNSTTKKASTNDDDDDDDDSLFLSKLEVLLVEVHDDALEKCILNNETEALKRARGADEDLEECYNPALNAIVNLFGDIESLEMPTVFNHTQQFCKIYSSLEGQCTKEYHENIKPCLSERDMRGIEIHDKMLNAAISYLCKLDTDLLTNAIENEFACSSSHLVGLVFCVIPPFQEIANKHNSSMAIPRALTGRGCRLYKDMAHCINEELKTCSNHTYTDIITGLINVTVNAVPSCPSERTEWEEEMDLAFQRLHREEQQQTSMLKNIKSQVDELMRIELKHQTIQEKINGKEDLDRQNKDNVLNTILKILQEHTENKTPSRK